MFIKKNKSIIIPVFFVFLLVLAFLIPGCSKPKPDGNLAEDTAPNIGALAPEFVLKDLEGNEHKLSDFKGNVVIVNFWTTWCRYCLVEMPYLENLHISQEDVTVIAVNVNESRSDVQAFIVEQGFSFPVLLDLEGEVSSNYRIRAYPTTFAISPEGIISSIKVGAFDAAGLKQLVESARNN
ncbi:MAG: redoxin domain-containing protein [Bacillota bacterium]|nr:redoxin domain-containing protein [Bacillota bacterium]